VFRSPFGFQRGTRKHDGATLGSAATVAADEASGLTLARVRKASHIGAEVNHYSYSQGDRYTVRCGVRVSSVTPCRSHTLVVAFALSAML
jgi:hypothetical protein